MKKSVGGTDTVIEVGAGGGIAASFIAYEYTATANQATFSGADSYSNTLAYNTGTPPKVQVFMNGILLDEGSSADYTGTNGTSVVLTTAADAGDLIQIHAYKSDVSIVTDLSFADNQKLKFGDSLDLEIFHDGSNSYINESGTGALVLQSAGPAIVLEKTNGENMILANTDGAVTLYYNGSAKIATTSTGIDVTGEVQADSLDIDGLSVLTSNNNATPLTLERASATSDQVGIQFSAGNSRYFGKGTDDEPYWATSANLTAGSKIVTAGNFTGILDSTYYQSGDNISVGSITATDLVTENNVTKDGQGPYDWVTVGAGSRAAALRINDIAGANYIIRAGGYGLRFMKHVDAGTDSFVDVMRFNATSVSDTTADVAITNNLAVGGAITTSGVITANGTSGSSFYGITLSRSSSGTTTPDLWGSSGTLVIGTSSSDEVLGMSGTAATFYGTLASGAFTSSGAIVGSSVQSTGNLFGTNGLHTLNTAGNGWDHTINRNGGSPTANLPGGITSGNITTTGYLRGPSTFTIDPAAHGDDTGTVVIAGNLQIDGTTTTINSTTLTVDDKNITLASGSANAAAANGAGLTVAGASANIVYESTNDRWTLNKEVFAQNGFMIGTTSTDVGLIKNSSGVFDFQAQSGREISFSNVTNGEHVRIDADGKVGIGTTDPIRPLHVNGGTTDYVARFESSDNNAGIELKDSTSTAAIRTQNGHIVYIADTGNAVGASSHRWNIDNLSTGEKMRLNAAGELGIGTTNPSEKLVVNVNSTGIKAGLILNNQHGYGSGVGVASTALQFGRDNTPDDGQTIITGQIYSGNEQETTSNPGFMAFSTKSGASPYTLTEHMRIDSTGNVGIGTTNPSSTFQVEGPGDYLANFKSSDATSGIKLTDSSSQSRVVNISGHLVLVADANNNSSNSTIRFNIDTASVAASDSSMILTSTGLGIGTSSPGYKLDLGGTTGNTANTLRLHQNNGGTALRIGAGSGSSDVVLWRIDGDSSNSNHGGATNLGAYGYSLKYFGVGSGQDNRLKLLADNLGASSQNVVYNVGQNGDINFEQKVGIGTTAPSKPLHVQFSGDHGARIESEDNHASLYIDSHTAYGQYIRFTENNADKYWINSTSGKLVFRPAATGTVTNQVIFDASGNVGIGTNAPDIQLHVKSATNTFAQVKVEAGADGHDSSVAYSQAGTIKGISGYDDSTDTVAIKYGTFGGSGIDIDSSGNVGINETNPTTTLTVGGIVQIKESSNTAFYGANYVRMFGDQNYYFRNTGGATRAHISMADGDLNLYNSSTVLTNRISTNSDSYFNGGNVGIGTSSPGDKLTIEGSGAQVLSIYSTDTGSQSTAKTFINLYGENTNGDKRLQGQIASAPGHNASNAGELHFSTNNSSSALARRMTIREDGNVGIGETTPTHKLHVAGDIRIDNGSALKLYNAAGNGWAQIGYNNTLNLVEIQRDFQSGTDSTNNLGSSAKKWLSVYSDTIKAGNGTNAAPAYTFDSDQNTGMYIDSTADTLRFSTGGAQRMFLNSAGITSASNVYTGSANEFRNYGGTWKATTGTAAGDFEFRGNTGGTNTGLMYMDTSTGRVAVGNGFNSTNVKAALQVEVLGIETNQSSVASTSQYTCESFPAADFRSARYTVQVTNVTDSTYQITEILLIHDGTTPSMTEYSTIFTGSAREASFDADISSSNVRLLATPASTDSMQFKVVRHSILV